MMKFKFAVLYLLIVLSLDSLGHFAGQADYARFSYFKLVLQWPPSLCNVGNNRCSVNPLPSNFIIHGLWPDNLSGRPLQYCYQVDYYPIPDQDLRALLETHWPNILDGPQYNDELWDRQWRKHGTCALLFYCEVPYFDLAVELKGYYDILDLLTTNHVNVGGWYSLERIRAIIQQRTGFFPDFGCSVDRNQRQQLSEVRICYTTDGDIMHCPPARWGTQCPQNVYFPPFP